MKTGPLSFLIGIDVGTTSVKGILTDHMGEPVAFSKQEYTLETGEGDTCEFDPQVNGPGPDRYQIHTKVEFEDYCSKIETCSIIYSGKLPGSPWK